MVLSAWNQMVWNTAIVISLLSERRRSTLTNRLLS